MKKLFSVAFLCAGLALASCGHKVDASNVTDTTATSPGISTDSAGKSHDTSSKATNNTSRVNDSAKSRGLRPK